MVLDRIEEQVDYEDLDGSSNDPTEIREIEIPGRRDNYAKSYYDLLTTVEIGTVYTVDEYEAEEEGSPTDSVEGIDEEIRERSDYSATIAIGPTEDGESTAVYVVGHEDAEGPIQAIGGGDGGAAGSAAIVEVEDSDGETVNDEDGDAMTALQFPVYQDSDEAPTEHLEFGQAVAIEEDNDIYFKTS